jgi:diguanylate cyclase (GGDEF)-like protein
VPIHHFDFLPFVGLSVLIAGLAFSALLPAAGRSLERRRLLWAQSWVYAALAWAGMGAVATGRAAPLVGAPPTGSPLEPWVVPAALLVSGALFALLLRRRLAEQARQVQRRQDEVFQGLRERETLYQRVVDALPGGVVLLDSGGAVVAANAGAARLLRRRADELPGALLHGDATEIFGSRGELLDPERRPGALAQRRQASSGQVLGWHVEGKLRWFLSSVQPMDQDLSVYSFLEITQERGAQEQLAYRANHDELTGLPNRHRFKQALTEAMYASFWQRDRVAVLLLDLDQFRNVNGMWGHLAGDEVLRAITGRLRDLLPPGASAARFGGDEFAVCLGGVENREEALAFAGHLCAELGKVFSQGDTRVQVGVSAGLSFYPDDAHDEDTLLQYADLALSAARSTGPGGVAAFDGAMALRRERRVKMSEALRSALERGELSLVYQPVVALQTGELRSCEALLRWEDSPWGAVSPAEFVPLAEETGLIDALGQWGLEQACRQARAWADAGTPLKVAVNLSALQFRAGTLPALVADVLERTGLDPASLELEVTADTLAGNRPSVQRQLGELRSRGVTVALADFGVGHLAPGALRDLPVDRIKLGRPFVRDLEDCDKQTAVIGALLQLAAHLGLEVVAEGIETAPQHDLWRDLACPLGQGYLLGRPAPAETMTGLLRPRA